MRERWQVRGAILREENLGRVWNLWHGSRWKIGRRRSCAVSLFDDPAVHSGQARIHFESGSFVLHDFGEANPLYLNGRKLAGDVVVLRTGDRFRAGRHSALVFEDTGIPPAEEFEPSPGEPLERALRAADTLAVVPDLCVACAELVAGRIDPEVGLRALDRLVETGLSGLLTAIRDSAMAAACDATEAGRRLTAAAVLERIAAAGDDQARRALRAAAGHRTSP